MPCLALMKQVLASLQKQASVLESESNSIYLLLPILPCFSKQNWVYLLLPFLAFQLKVAATSSSCRFLPSIEANWVPLLLLLHLFKQLSNSKLNSTTFLLLIAPK
jgi:hypothetical protein